MKKMKKIFLWFLACYISLAWFIGLLVRCQKEDISFSTPPPVDINACIDSHNSWLKISFTNNSPYTIAAIKFYFECFNVYGEYIKNSNCNCIYQRHSIQAGEVKECKYYISKSNVKSIKIYLYSVYFKNNCYPEWGYRELSPEQIKYSPAIRIEIND